MARKSKAKFNMKGHSIPGIKGFKDNSPLDGRATSSAFQMKESPLHETKLGEDVEFTEPELGEEDPFAHLKWKSQGSRTGVQFGMEEAMKAAQRLRGKKGEEEEEEETTDVIEEQIESTELPEVKEIESPEIVPPLTTEEEAPIIPLPEVEEKTTKPYEVQSGDNLSRIAKANNMTLEELLEKNPEYKANPNFVRRGATLNL